MVRGDESSLKCGFILTAGIYGNQGTVLIDYCPPKNVGLDIVYQDQALIIVNKPSGLLSVPGRGEDKQDCMLSRLQAHNEAFVVHRLDMDTSGLIIYALDIDTQRLMSGLFEQRLVEKKYEAIVQGCIQEENGLIDFPLSPDWPNRPRQKVDTTGGKPSITRWQRVSIDSQNLTSRVWLYPETGRSHQLRVHLQAIGYPILGDKLYCSANSFEQAPRLLLHSSYLKFCHPVLNKLVLVECPPEF